MDTKDSNRREDVSRAPHPIQHQRRRNREVEAVDGARHGDAREPRTGGRHRLGQAVALAAHEDGRGTARRARNVTIERAREYSPVRDVKL